MHAFVELIIEFPQVILIQFGDNSQLKIYAKLELITELFLKQQSLQFSMQELALVMMKLFESFEQPLISTSLEDKIIDFCTSRSNPNSVDINKF